jgi:hypothetical protein
MALTIRGESRGLDLELVSKPKREALVDSVCQSGRDEKDVPNQSEWVDSMNTILADALVSMSVRDEKWEVQTLRCTVEAVSPPPGISAMV